MSKGAKRRPSFVSESILEENWRRTFGGTRSKKERLEAAGWVFGDADEFFSEGAQNWLATRLDGEKLKQLIEVIRRA